MHRVSVFSLAICLAVQIAAAQPVEPSPYADFVEGDFPFITTTVVGDSLSAAVPDSNWTVRGIAVQLGHDTYFAFDPDLLRMAIAWTGEFLSMVTMAQVSYHRLDKGNADPVVLGRPLAATGMYPGWMAEPAYHDPRAPGPAADDPGRGPLPGEMGEFRGLYVHGNGVVLAYRLADAEIYEQPGVRRDGHVRLVTRAFEVGASSVPLTLVAAEAPRASRMETAPGEVVVEHPDGTVTAVLAPGSDALSVDEGRYVTLTTPASSETRRFWVGVWTGSRSDLDRVRALGRSPVFLDDGFRRGGPSRWPEVIRTEVDLAADTAAFVYDHLGLPDPNPWRRNVRPADLAFFEDGRAALLTFDGDVWMVDGLHGSTAAWRRFASGLYEPLAVEIVDGELYVYGREGIVRLHDLNGDDEADFYEAFAPGIIQSTVSREWPFDLVARPGGGFFASQGGALHSAASAGRTPVMPGFLRGSPHNGAVLEVSADGRSVRRYATGFRGPYLGIHPRTGLLTASDQQGNFVPSTPIYVVEWDGYYGVPATAHRPDPLPEARPPITWIPHRADPSATGQVWVDAEGNGPLSGRLVSLSYGRSGAFRIYVDSLAAPWQGAAVALPDDGRSPTLKGAMNPVDGRLYVAGFQVWGSTAQRLASLRRLRYTGLPSDLPEEVRAGHQGILLRFDGPLEPANPSNFTIRRWNYLRSEQYGSGHYRLDGSEGEESLRAAAVHRSRDGRALLVVVPDMREVMQMTVEYTLARPDGDVFSGSVYLTLNDVRLLDLASYGLEAVDWQRDLANAPVPEDAPASAPVEATAVRGRHLFNELGCVACHSTDGPRPGNLGPSLRRLFGSMRPLESGEEVLADAAYLRRSILDPSEDVVRGFDQEMPSFRGILDEGDVESIILYIRSLDDETDE